MQTTQRKGRRRTSGQGRLRCYHQRRALGQGRHRPGIISPNHTIPTPKLTTRQTVEQCKSFGRNALAFPADVTDLSQVNAMVEKTVSELGPLQVMVANAGVVQVKPLLDVTPEDNKFVFDVNYLGVFHCYQAAAKQMLAQGKPPAHPPIEHAAGAAPVPSAGTYKIIGACSIAAMSPYALIGPYCASKWAVRGLSQCFAREMAPNGITVNCYAPGIVGTAMWEQLDEALGKHYGQAAGEVRAQEAKKAALGRVSVPEDVSGLVSYLAGPDSDYVSVLWWSCRWTRY